jgi:hypothetical protein
MHVQLHDQRVLVRPFERRIMAGFNPISGPLAAYQALPLQEREAIRKAAVRRAERQREAMRQAFSWEG